VDSFDYLIIQLAAEEGFCSVKLVSLSVSQSVIIPNFIEIHEAVSEMKHPGRQKEIIPPIYVINLFTSWKEPKTRRIGLDLPYSLNSIASSFYFRTYFKAQLRYSLSKPEPVEGSALLVRILKLPGWILDHETGSTDRVFFIFLSPSWTVLDS
jgi:hypothetical protein